MLEQKKPKTDLYPKIAAILMPGKMHKFHQIWLEELGVAAKQVL